MKLIARTIEELDKVLEELMSNKAQAQHRLTLLRLNLIGYQTFRHNRASAGGKNAMANRWGVSVDEKAALLGTK